MDIPARRLTIISMLMVVFAVALAAAVSADTQRRRHIYTGSIADCTAYTAQFCERAGLWSGFEEKREPVFLSDLRKNKTTEHLK